MPMEISNGQKTAAMISIGVMAMLAICTNMALGWFYVPADYNSIQGSMEFLKNLLLMILGFLTGASKPDTHQLIHKDNKEASKLTDEKP